MTAEGTAKFTGIERVLDNLDREFACRPIAATAASACALILMVGVEASMRGWWNASSSERPKSTRYDMICSTVGKIVRPPAAPIASAGVPSR